MTSILFVGGVPGAGKTTACRALVDRTPGASHVGAGTLIQTVVSGAEAQYSRPTVRDQRSATAYQELLVAEFTLQRAVATGHLILDGHFVVPTSAGLQPVSPGVFRRLHVQVLALVHAPVDTVVERLRARGAATWWDGGRHAIERFMELERAHANAVARTLGLRLVYVGDDLELEPLLEALSAT